MDEFVSLIFFAAVAFSSQPAFSQDNVIDFGEDRKALHIPFADRKVVIEPAFEDYAFMLFDVCDAMELSTAECEIYPMNGDLGGNAIATILDGNRLVVYDRKLSAIIGGDGAEMVIAHEVGHHYCGHLEKEPDPKMELEADRFAAAAMRRMGRPLDATLSTVSILSERPSKTHPANTDRVRAMLDGWDKPDTGKNCKK